MLDSKAGSNATLHSSRDQSVPIALLAAHNVMRWIILALAILTLVKAAQGLRGGLPYAEARRVGAMFMGSLHLQLVLGLLLFLTSPQDPAVFVAITAMLVAIGLLACWIPARRAAALHPVKALRHE